jgi:rhomboid protease GluP
MSDLGRSRDHPDFASLLARPPLLSFTMFGFMGSVFAIQWRLDALHDGYALHLLGAVSGFSVRDGDLHRLVAATFLHADVHHLVRNVVALTLPGILLEAWLGRLRVLLLFASSMIAATAMTAFVAPSAIGVGASGIVAGLVGGLFVLISKTWRSPGREWRVLRWSLICMVPLEIAVAWGIEGVGWVAHGAGLATGFGITWLLERCGERIEPVFRVTAVLLVAFVAYSVIRAAWDVSRLDLGDLEGSALARLREPGAAPGELAVASGHLLDRHSDSEAALRLALELAERGLEARPGWPRLREQLEAIRADAAGRLASPPTPPPSGGPRSSRAPRRGRARRGPGRGRPRGGR